MRKPSEGLTLIEVLVALAVLGIGIVSLVQLQGTALQYTANAEGIRTVTQVAESELEWRRRTSERSTTCVTFRPSWIDECTVTLTELGTNAFEVTVNVSGRQSSAQLVSFQTGQSYVGGILTEFATLPDEDEDGPSDPTDPTDPTDPVEPPPAPCVNPAGREIPCPRN